MDDQHVGRRAFITAAGAGASSALLLPGGEGPVEAASRVAARQVVPAVLDPEHVVQLQLPPAGFETSRQEGGATIMAGTFVPSSSTTVVDVDVAGMFAGWGGGYFAFNIGVLPDPPPEPWEPGGGNRITRCNHSSRSPLPGVTEYAHFPIGIMNANTIGARVGRRMILTGLTAEREYQWELRCAGLSFFKQHTFADGAQPTRVLATPDDLYAWVTLRGSNRLALLQLGWAELWQLFGYSEEMTCIAEVPLAGTPTCLALQPGGDLLATIDETANEIVLVDTTALIVDTAVSPPTGVTLSTTEVMFSADGAKLYAGGWNDGRLHRLDVATRSWDQVTDVDVGGSPALLPLTISDDGRYLWCSSFWNRHVIRVDLQPSTPSSSIVYTMPSGSVGPTSAAVREADGSIVFVDAVNNLVRHVSSSGTLLKTWSSTISGQGTQNEHSSVVIDADEVRAFWTADGVVGWAWIDSGNVINASHSFFPDDPVYGDVALTSNEGTLLALPTTASVVHWPGGNVRIHPDLDNPVVFGADHAHVTFTGAEALLG